MATHSLRDYADLLDERGLLAGEQAQDLPSDDAVCHVTADSRDVVPGTLFVCKGTHFREEFLVQAQERGALCYLSETAHPDATLPHLAVTDVRAAMAETAALFYERPWERVKVVGITGTKGKSTTAYYVKSILDHMTRDTSGENGIMSSIETFDGLERFESHLTTPEPIDLQRHLSHAIETGMDHMVMEVSSQALKYGRVGGGLRFSVGCFLNIDNDHISPIEHSDWEDYFTSKLKIFRQCRTAVVNLDTDHADRVLLAAQEAERVVTFSCKDPTADLIGSDLHKDGDEYVVFHARGLGIDRQFRLSMPGLFNCQNALAAIAICTLLGATEHDLYAGLLQARVPGRMEVYANADRRVIAIVDYAHNALSFERLFQSVREEYPDHKVTIVFGCPGGKAFDRRRDLGRIAGREADFVYLTEEDPGEEDVCAICDEVASYVRAEGCPYAMETDRGAAIHAAIMACEERTVVLVTGKGAETREKRGLEYIDVPSDVDFVREALDEYDQSHRLDGLGQVQGLLATLPRLYACDGKTVVIKCGGASLEANEATDAIFEDAAALRMAGARVVIVHGGGGGINGWLSRLNIEPHFVDGYRVTDDETMDVVEMALSGQTNKRIVGTLQRQGIKAAGISGRDGEVLCAEPREDSAWLGRVGTMRSVNPSLVRALLDAGYVPVISPVASDGFGHAMNVNADEAACSIAGALGAEYLFFVTDIDGIYMDVGHEKTLMRSMSADCAREILSEGLVSGGMVPKVTSCVSALDAGIQRVMVVDGRVDHAILMAVAAHQLHGTLVTTNAEAGL